MRTLVLGFTASLICLAVVATEAEAAKRLGGARSLGAQRNVAKAFPAAKPAKPVQAPTGTPAGTQPASSGAKWGPLLGGLALGGALGWLLGANGFGGLLVGMLLIGLLASAAMFLLRGWSQRRGDGPRHLPYVAAGSRGSYLEMGSETVAAPPPSQSAGFDAPPRHVEGVMANVPAGFDVAQFLRSAKLNYMRLQIANDRGDLDELREFASDELFEELKKDVRSRGNQKQQTDVLALNADLLEVQTEGDKHWASVRFSGMIRESPNEAPIGFEEIWNLARPVSGTQGWQLAGIQQMH